MWKIIFGKDCAQGGASQEVEDAYEQLRSQRAGGSQTNENDYRSSFEDFPGYETPPLTENVDAHDISSGNSGRRTSAEKMSAPKRRRDSTDEVFMDFLSKLHADTNSRLDVISSRIDYDFDMGKARQEVYDKLGTVEGLTGDQRYDLCDILSDKPQRLEVFMGIPANARLGYVLRFLDHHRMWP